MLKTGEECEVETRFLNPQTDVSSPRGTQKSADLADVQVVEIIKSSPQGPTGFSIVYFFSKLSEINMA